MFTDKEIQDQWKAYSYWQRWVGRYHSEITELERRREHCSAMAEKMKKEHSEMVRANRASK